MEMEISDFATKVRGRGDEAICLFSLITNLAAKLPGNIVARAVKEEIKIINEASHEPIYQA